MKAAWALGALAIFAVLATANAGGYRYGVSDQAYYAAAVLKARTPSLFPRDTPLIEAESRFQLSDKLLGWLSRSLHVDLPQLFLALQVVTLLTLAGAAAAYARALGFSWWTTAAFLSLLTLRHQITKTGANTLEGYMHPRVLAFAIGLGALAAVVRRRPLVAMTLLVIAAVVHPTTAVWFGLAVITGLVVDRRDRRDRRAWTLAAVVTLSAAALATWALTLGPLAGRLVTMDPAWRAVIADREYLFPSRWPLYAWVLNLGSLAIIWALFRLRRAQHVAVPAEKALTIGYGALVIVFLASVPFAAHGVAIAIQAQVNRVFWILDVAATASIAWWLMSGPAGRTAGRRVAVLATILLLSAVRGSYVLAHAGDRRLVAVTLDHTPWTDAMTWLSRQPSSWNVLADPGHAWKYGVSVRVASGHDTVLEAGKDPALAMYSRAIATRVAEREAALANYQELTTADIRRAAARFGADVVITERTHKLQLPVLYENSTFTVYDVRQTMKDDGP